MTVLPTPTPTPLTAAVLPTTTATPTTAPAASTPAASPTVQPTTAATPAPTPKPTATPKPATGVYNNPWGFDFKAGNLIYDPPRRFCDYFPCIATFWNGKGYVVECRSGKFSLSGGRSGACSGHGGVNRTLYSH